ncbi:MAG: radical SAM protein [Candidatus Altiarchaeota archaeon]
MFDKSKYIDTTESYCPVCLDVIKADLIVENDQIVISKICKKHGKFKALYIWDDPGLYKGLSSINKIKNDHPNGIIIDLTLGCNMNCPFCFAFSKEEAEKFKEPTLEEISEKLKKFKKSKEKKPLTIFLFGGEPTLREDLAAIIKEIKNHGFEACLFTNGLKLENESYVCELKKAGLDYVVLQFDGLNESTYKKIRNENLLRIKLKAIQNLRKNGIIVDFFSVIIKNVNENEIGNIILFAAKNSDIVKNVYLSTITYEGRFPVEMKQLTNFERLKLIEKEFDITKDDFLICTKFDSYFSEFIRKLTNIETKHLAMCDIMCYLYLTKSEEIVPLNKLIDLEKLSKLFEESIALIDKKNTKIGVFEYIKLSIKFLRIFLYLLSSANKRHLLYFLKYSLLSLKPLCYGKPPKNRFNKLFRVIVTQFQDRYNIDLKTFENCNLWAENLDGDIRPFCERNILRE